MSLVSSSEFDWEGDLLVGTRFVVEDEPARGEPVAELLLATLSIAGSTCARFRGRKVDFCSAIALTRMTRGRGVDKWDYCSQRDMLSNNAWVELGADCVAKKKMLCGQ